MGRSRSSSLVRFRENGGGGVQEEEDFPEGAGNLGKFGSKLAKPIEAGRDNNSIVVRDGKHGVFSNYWDKLDHIALVVSDVGRSVSFYAELVGLEQVNRPDFDRFGAWLSFGNLELHIIKGIPPVRQTDPDLIVTHMAFQVFDMATAKAKLTEMGVPWRKNITVPQMDGSIVDQAFFQDPDGYYVEFNDYYHPAEGHPASRLSKKKSRSTLMLAKPLLKSNIRSREPLPSLTIEMFRRTKRWISEARVGVFNRHKDAKKDKEEKRTEKVILSERSIPQWEQISADRRKLGNLIRRRDIYADVMQSVSTEDFLRELLKRFGNNVPMLHDYLMGREIRKGTFTLEPPAFYERDGTFYQPPKFEVKIYEPRV